MSTTVAAMVAMAQKDIESLSPEEFAEEIAARDAVVIDLREVDERVESGSIPGAVHVPRGMLEFRADPTHPYYDARLSPDTRVLLYCASGGRSALAAKPLHELGYHNVAHLGGGFNAWATAGGTVAHRPVSPY